MLFTTALATLVAFAAAAQDSRTFAVLHFYGDGPLVTVRADPIVSPGVPSSHLHTVMGGNNFGLNATGDSLKESTCTNGLIKNDKSNYWFPTLFFQDPTTGEFEQVPMFYMNVYYFFEATNDDIKAFPTGLQMVSGNAALRATPAGANGGDQLDFSAGPTQPAQFTCPRSSYNPPSYPVGSDGSVAGIQDPNNQGAGMGFPFQECDGYASPLRMDLHFPSCYNPAAGLTNFKENMQFPSSASGGKQDCPAGWTHTPHIFFEVYWNTPLFVDRWTQDGKSQPFILSDGDRTGFSVHGDFIAAWDEPTLQTIIDTCNAGDSGMDKCPTIIGGVNDPSQTCNIQPMVDEVTTGVLSKLPGNNPPAGWGVGSSAPASGGSGSGSPAPVSSQAAPPPAATSTSAGSAAAPPPPPPAATTSTTAAAAAAPPPAESPSSLPSKVEQSAPPAAPPAAASTTAAPAGNGDGVVTSTVWETTTAWVTVTVTDSGAAPTASAAPATGVNSTAHPDIDGFKYVGCYQDASQRVLAGETLPNLGKVSDTNCVTYCASKGWTVAGTEYGGQCFCGNSLVAATPLDEASCNLPCEGDASQTCGGDWALSLYTQDGTVPQGSAKKARHFSNHLHRRGPSVRRR